MFTSRMVYNSLCFFSIKLMKGNEFESNSDWKVRFLAKREFEENINCMEFYEEIRCNTHRIW